MTANNPSDHPLPPLRSVRLTNETDVLAFVPYTLGFHPDESVVVLGLGPRGGPMVARADLSDDADELRAATEEVSRAAACSGVVQALVVAYTGDVARGFAVVDDMVEALEVRGVSVLHAFRADGERWFPLSAADPGWAVGTAYDVSTHALSAHAVAEGRVTYADREDLAASLDPAEPGLVDEVADALDALDALGSADGSADRGGSWCDDVGLLRAEARWAVAWVGDRVAHEVEVPRWPAADEVARVLRVLAVDEGREVLWTGITRTSAPAHVRLWRTVARLAPDGHRAPAWAVLAFAAWLEGNGALAWCAVDRARESDPDLGLTAFVAGALEGAVHPGTWEPVDPSSLRLLSA